MGATGPVGPQVTGFELAITQDIVTSLLFVGAVLRISFAGVDQQRNASLGPFLVRTTHKILASEL